jgi:hypothetical protein
MIAWSTSHCAGQLNSIAYVLINGTCTHADNPLCAHQRWPQNLEASTIGKQRCLPTIRALDKTLHPDLR